MAPLTKDILNEHDLLMSKQKPSTEESYAAQVVKREKMHKLHCQVGLDMGYKILIDKDQVDDTASKTTSPQEAESFSIWENFPPDEPSTEGPLERYFTPDGCSDPCYVARHALGSHFADSASVETRRIHAETCLKIIDQNRNATKGSTHAQTGATKQP